jgi:hypothetical protein
VSAKACESAPLEDRPVPERARIAKGASAKTRKHFADRFRPFSASARSAERLASSAPVSRLSRREPESAGKARPAARDELPLDAPAFPVPALPREKDLAPRHLDPNAPRGYPRRSAAADRCDVRLISPPAFPHADAAHCRSTSSSPSRSSSRTSFSLARR